MFKCVKSFLRSVSSRAKKIVLSCTTALSLAIMSCVCAFAEGETASASSQITSSLSSAFSSIQSDIFGFILVALPVALAVFGAILGIKKAISLFKSFIGR